MRQEQDLEDSHKINAPLVDTLKIILLSVTGN